MEMAVEAQRSFRLWEETTTTLLATAGAVAQAQQPSKKIGVNLLSIAANSDLSQDPGETVNLRRKYPQVMEDLRNLLLRGQGEVKAN
jgi:hypothetical protein